MPSPEMFQPMADGVLLAVSAIAAILYNFNLRSSPTYLRMAFKTTSTALLSALAYQRGGPHLIVGALGFGSLGDAFLAWDSGSGKGSERNFLCGLGSFLVAHVLYLALFAQSGGGKEQLLADTWRIATATFFLVVVAPTMTALLVPRVPRDLRLPIVVYTATIGMMLLTALTLDSTLVITGAALFTTSDAILSAEKFLIPGSAYSPAMQYAVWVLYYTGQLLITVGLVPGG